MRLRVFTSRARTPARCAPSTCKAGFATFLALTAGVAPRAHAQDVRIDPIACWWRTSASAVRVGQPFDVVLTCAVLENHDVTVVPDESGLDATSMQMPPFEVIRGKHPADLRTDTRRFFQYAYTLRLIADDAFGKDLPLPELQMNYKIETRVKGEALQGRTQAYLLPKLSVRVLSLVPNDAPDIRDTARDTFEDVNARTFRADTFFVVSSVLFTVGGVIALIALVGAIRRTRRARTPAQRFVSDRRVLRGAARELSTVRREREASGWTDALAARATAAVRIAGAYALSRRVSQTVAANGADRQEGQILVRRRNPRVERVFLSASVTAEALAHALADANGALRGRREDLEQLQIALNRFTAAQYSRSSPPGDDALDESLARTADLVRRLANKELWRNPFRGSHPWVR